MILLSHMLKNVLILVLIVAVVGLVWYSFGPQIQKHLGAIPGVSSPTGVTPKDQSACAQVVTSARNPKTGDIRQFPTPCDVPDGWEVIQNDIPGFDLQVQ